MSFTDHCISLALAERYMIRRVFTFDEHFAYAGLKMV